MAKRLEFVDIDQQSSVSPITDWSKCVICQEQTEEKLECPANSKRRDSGAGCRSFVQNIQLFQEMNILPTSLNLERLDQGDVIEETLMVKKASWHKSCWCKFNSTKLKEQKNVSLTVPVKLRRFVTHAPKQTRVASVLVASIATSPLSIRTTERLPH